MNLDQASVLLRRLDPLRRAMETARGVGGLPERNWLKTVRKETGATQSAVAARLGISRQGYDQFERSEERSAISIGTLRRAAAVLDCELVYFLVPAREIAPPQPDIAVALAPASPETGSFGDSGGPGPGELAIELR